MTDLLVDPVRDGFPYVVPGEGRARLDGLCFNFLPSWWHRGHGVDFGERWVFDPDYRTETLRFMERTVHERLPGLDIGSADPQPVVTMPDFGNAITPAFAGCRVEYPVDNYPWSHHLERARVPGLRVPARPGTRSRTRRSCGRPGTSSAKLGLAAPPRLPPRGVQNDAVLIRGIEFFEDAVVDPPACRRLLDFSAGILSAVIEANAGFGSLDDVVLANCTTPMSGARLLRGTGAAPRAPGPRSRPCPRDEVRHPPLRGGRSVSADLPPKFERLEWIEIGWGSDAAPGARGVSGSDGAIHRAALVRQLVEPRRGAGRASRG